MKHCDKNIFYICTMKKGIFLSLVFTAYMLMSVAYADSSADSPKHPKTSCCITKDISAKVEVAKESSFDFTLPPFVVTIVGFEADLSKGEYLLPIAAKPISEMKNSEQEKNKGSPNLSNNGVWFALLTKT